MNAKVVSVLKYLLLLSIAFALLAYAFKGVSLRAIYTDLLHVKVSWVLFSLVFGCISLVSRAHRWNLLIEPLGYYPPLHKTTYSLAVGYFANLIFPRLGEITRCGSLSKTESIPFSSLLGTVIAERIIDLICLIICLLFVTIIEYKRIGEFLNETIFSPLGDKIDQLFSSSIILISVGIVFVLIMVTLYYFFSGSKNRGKGSKLSQLGLGLVNGLKTVGKLKHKWSFIFHTVLIWVSYLMSVYLCFFALPSTSDLGLKTGLFLLVVGGLGMAAPVQGGIGTYHLLVSQGLMLYGVTKQDGLTFATLVHTLTFVFVIIFGVIGFLLLFSANNKRDKSEKSYAENRNED